MKTLTPFGVRDYLPEEVEKRTELIDSMIAVLKQNGYKRIITPSIEYEDSIQHAMGPELREKSIEFLDSSGNRLLLRPEHTTPIARIVSNRLQDTPKPLLFYYADSVFRKDRIQGETEFIQVGVEHIGADGIQSDANIIINCIETAKAAGLTDIGIDIGHPDLSEQHNATDIDRIKQGLFLELDNIPERGDKKSVSNSPYLSELYDILESAGYASHIAFNHGLIKRNNYYTGLFFECFQQGYGKLIGTGGRYDTLLAEFGYPCPAIGFALRVDRIQGALS